MISDHISVCSILLFVHVFVYVIVCNACMCRYALTSDKAVSSKKYNLLSWSPGQYDMATFSYSESLKYEVEKDYINNYSKIPLDSGAPAASPSAAVKKTAEPGGRFSSFRSRLSTKVSPLFKRWDQHSALYDVSYRGDLFML